MPTYYLAGLMYINGCHDDGDQRVLFPDGSNDPDVQPPLAATILVAKDDCVSDTFGAARTLRELDVDGKPTEFYEFQLKKRTRVSLPHSGRVACVKLDRGLPRAEDADFVPNLVDPDTIAEIVIGGGTLKARALAGTPIVEWTVDEDRKAPATITATLLDAKREPTKDQWTVTVNGDAAVIFAHSSDLFAEAPDNGWGEDGGDGGDGGGGSEWGGPPTSDSKAKKGDYAGAKLYSKIAKNPVDPEKFADHAKVNEPQGDIPDHEQRDGLKALKVRFAWPFANPPWCCPNKHDHDHDHDHDHG